MKKIFLKIIFAIMLGISSLFIIDIESYAASAGISASNIKVNVGDSVNINVTADAVSWNLKVDGSGVSDKIAGGNSNAENEKINKSYKLDTSKPGTYTVTLSGDVTDAKGHVNISDSVTIIVEEKKEDKPIEEPKPTEIPKPTEEVKPTEPENNEPKFKDVNETVYVQQESVNVRPACSTSGGTYGTLKKGDSVTRTGIGIESVNGYIWSRIIYNGNTAYVISKSLTTELDEEKKDEEDKDKKEEKSSVKTLKILNIVGYELEPKFDPEIKNYSIKLSEDDTDDELDIKAEPEDEKAKVVITGNENFKVGNNIVKIVVTAEDGTTRMYTITVAKTNENGVVDSLKLDKLTVTNGNLEPDFNPDITSYKILVEDPSTITVDDIIATSTDKDVKVTVAENEKTDDGEKTITIMLENKDGSKTGVYQIFVRKPVVNQALITQNNTDFTMYYILGGVIGVLLLIIVVIIIVLKKSSDDEEDDEEFEQSADLKNDFIQPNDNLNYNEMIERKNNQSQILNDGSYDENEDKYKVNYINTDDVDYESEKTQMYKSYKNEEDNNTDFLNKDDDKKGKHF